MTPDEDRLRRPVDRPSNRSSSPGSEAPAPPRSRAASGLKQLLFAFTNRHRGKALELDATKETLRVLGPEGEPLLVVNSEVALDHLLSHAQDADAQASSRGPNRATALSVSVTAADGRVLDARCPGVGPRGVFLESPASFTLGSSVALVIVPPGEAARPLHMKGVVTWACPKPDEFGFGPGVGVAVTSLSSELAAHLRGTGRSSRSGSP